MGGYTARLARTWVVQPGPEDSLHIQVGHQQRLFKLGAVRHQLTTWPEDGAVAIEDQLVLSAHGVQVGHVELVVGSTGGDHPATEVAFAHMVGRGVDINHEIGPSVPLHCSGAGWVPDVFADVQTYAHAVDDEDGAFFTLLEVPLLVEHAVVGQVDLVIDAYDFPVVSEGTGVVDVVTGIDEAYGHGHIFRGGCCYAAHSFDVGLYEGGLEKEVFRWVASDGQLRKGDKVDRQLLGLLHVLQGLGDVALQVANGEVYLGQSQAERVHLVGQYSTAYLDRLRRAERRLGGLRLPSASTACCCRDSAARRRRASASRMLRYWDFNKASRAPGRRDLMAT